MKPDFKADKKRIEELEKYNEYSLEEHIIGKWINGKNIYRKVIIDNTSQAFYSIEHNIEDIEDLIELKGSVKQDNGTRLPFGFFTLYNGKEMYVSAFSNDTSVNLRMSEEYKDSSKIIILEYTKRG